MAKLTRSEDKKGKSPDRFYIGSGFFICGIFVKNYNRWLSTTRLKKKILVQDQGGEEF